LQCVHRCFPQSVTSGPGYRAGPREAEPEGVRGPKRGYAFRCREASPWVI
jgi:hypothetical protein